MSTAGTTSEHHQMLWKSIRFSLHSNPNYVSQIVWIGHASHDVLYSSLRDAAGLPESARFVLVTEEFPGSFVVLNDELGTLGIKVVVKEIGTFASPAEHQKSYYGDVEEVSMSSQKAHGHGRFYRHRNDESVQDFNPVTVRSDVAVPVINSHPEAYAQYPVHLSQEVEEDNSSSYRPIMSNNNKFHSPYRKGIQTLAYASTMDGIGETISISSSGSAAKRRRTTVACEPCHRAKVGCDEARPCRRCVRVGRADLCIDRSQKRIGRPRKSDEFEYYQNGYGEYSQESVPEHRAEDYPISMKELRPQNDAQTLADEVPPQAIILTSEEQDSEEASYSSKQISNPNIEETDSSTVQ